MMRPFLLTCAVLALCSAVLSAGQKPEKPKAPSDNYDELVAQYLATARQLSTAPAPEPNAWMTGLMSDQRARHVNDLVTVRVEESIIASGTADSSLSKDSKAALGTSSFFGVESKLPSWMNPENLVAAQGGTGFKGAGSTARSSMLTAVLTARVAEVLPNGDLVIEGVRELEVNGDRQIVVLTGVARVADLTPGNVVSSAAIGQLRIRYFGRGLMKDSLSPGWLVRILNKIF